MNRAVVGVGLFVAVSALLLFWRDDPPPQDADLIPAVSPLPEADNAYPVVAKLQAAIPRPFTTQEQELIKKRLDGVASAAEEARTDVMVAGSTEALALFARLPSRAAFQDPNYVDLKAINPNTPVPRMFAVVAAAKLESFRAESLLKRGRAPEALAAALAIVDAGRMFARSRSNLIVSLVGMLVTDIGARRALQVVDSGKLDRERLRAAAARLAAPSTAAAGLQDGLRYEYVNLSNVTDHLERYARSDSSRSRVRLLLLKAVAGGRSYLYMPHRTKALNAERFRALVAEAGKPCLLARVPPFRVLPYLFRPNMIGIILYDIAIPQYEKISIRRCESDFRLTAAATGAALRAYRLDHGRFPASLAELVPAYLPSAPVDPYTGAAPPYSARTGEIHSAGKDSDGKAL